MYWDNKIVSLITNKPSNILHLTIIYRLITLILTSFYFIYEMANITPLSKFGIILFVCLLGWYITIYQKKYMNQNSLLKIIVLIETFALILLLIPTGGIESPFILYALNPIIIAASFLSSFFCWGILAFYLTGFSIITFYLNSSLQFYEHLAANSSLFFEYLLLTSFVILFSWFNKELATKAEILNSQQNSLLEANQKLFNMNEMYKETLEHTMSLHHMLNRFSSKTALDTLAHEVTSALMKCTKKQSVFFCIFDVENKSYVSNRSNQDILQLITREWPIIKKQNDSFFHSLDNQNYWVKIVRSSMYIGVMGIEISNPNEIRSASLLRSTFEFIADLSGILLERINAEKRISQITINEEQNRIANEIHDTVSQKLFGIVYSLHSLRQKQPMLQKDEIIAEYDFLIKTANSSLKELRSSIYKLSSIKKGENPLFSILENHLNDYSKLNNIIISSHFHGNEHHIGNDLKNEIYRIICEACGNSVRHGESKRIEVELTITNAGLELSIKDDGIGFIQQDQLEQEIGLGLFNMQSSVKSYNGSFAIETKINQGTTIHINIPIRTNK